MFYLLLCRSLTYAQRSAKLLERKGISAPVIKAPPELSGNGCSYALRVPTRHYPRAMELLQDNGLTPRKTFFREDDQWQEVLA